MSTHVALVTGGARRIGKGIVTRLHADGYNICLHCHFSVAEAEGVAAALNAARADSVRVCVADLTSATDADGRTLGERCRGVLDFCYDVFGRCDVLVNNASAYKPTPLLSAAAAQDSAGGRGDTPELEEDVGDLFGSNAVAPFYLIRAFARCAVGTRSGSGGAEMPSSGGGPCVVNLVDSMANQPLSGFTVYTMAKHALEGLTKSAAAELAGEGIRVNAVAPGLCVMPPVLSAAEQDGYRSKVPLGQREGTVEEIAAAVSFLVSAEARYITGTTVNVDGGWSLTRA